jgi:hypothetical protein
MKALRLSPLGALCFIAAVALALAMLHVPANWEGWRLLSLIAAGIVGYLSRSTEAGTPTPSAPTNVAGQAVDSGPAAPDGAQNTSAPS